MGPKPLFDLIGQPLRGQHFRMVVEGLTEIDPVYAPNKPADRTTNSAADCFFSFRLCFCGAAHVRVPPVVGGAEALADGGVVAGAEALAVKLQCRSGLVYPQL